MRTFTLRSAAIAVSWVLIAATPAIAQTASPKVATPAVTPPPVVRWMFAPDFRAHPNQSSFPSYQGGTTVWSLRQSQSRNRDGNYTLLPSFSSSFGSPGIKAWHGNASGCVKLPAIGVNTLNKSLPLCAAHLPGKAAFARPAANRLAVVAWTSFFDGNVKISHDAIADVDPSCGDGITYYVDRSRIHHSGTTNLSATTLNNKDAATLPQATQPIKKGQSLYFIVDPGPNANNGCDTTQLQITIDRV